MSETVIAVGQGVGKDCVVGNRLINRYAVFNGLDRPHRITPNGEWEVLGVRQADPPSSVVQQTVVGAGLTVGYYAYKIVYASASSTRPVSVFDDSSNYTRGNPSTVLSVQITGANNSAIVGLPTIAQDGITHVLIYRSIVAATQAEAEVGPFYYVGQEDNGTAFFDDVIADDDVGVAVETDNYMPSSWRYAVSSAGYIFAGGNIVLGEGFTCTVTAGSSYVTASDDIFYDGIINWRFRVFDDTTGGANEAGMYFANYVDAHTLQLLDADGVAMNYNGTSAGSGKDFSVYLPGNVLRWCKFGEPESWPLGNAIEFEGDITGLGEMPNQPLLIVFSDSPSIHVLDLSIIGSATFKTTRSTISSTYSTSSHYSICPVEGRLRAIDFAMKAIIEIDGTAVRDISSSFVPLIFDFLKADMNDVKLWHCAYDQAQGLFGAFVTFSGSQRMVDFCIGQHVPTGGWFFNHEKDLLCTGYYRHAESGDSMILGGTEGPGNEWGGVWGRIWAPDVYDEWLPQGYLRSGLITAVNSANQIVVDTSANSLFAGTSGLAGRWVLVCDANGEYAQLGYISSNTSNTINIESVVGGLSYQGFSPSPEVGWKFYLGMIECRWGPKRFDFGDPDLLKKIDEVFCTVEGHNESELPFFRLYRGMEKSYTKQLNFEEHLYLDRTQTQTLSNKTYSKLEAVPRWGMAWYDRSYGKTVLSSISIVFTKIQ